MIGFTQGPWIVTDTYSNYVFNVVRMGNMDFKVGSEEDARLIAAAPELLAALIRLLDDSDEHLTIRGRKNLARAAIAKATGAA